MLYEERIEALISAALADGVLTEKEKQVLFKRAQAEGIDLDEFEMVLDARLVELQKAEKTKTEASAPKSNKYGDVRKCPVCGAMIPALAGVCPECGYEFSGIEANSSSKQLADLLLKTEIIDQKKQIIESFPIPLTKADLAEFVTSLKFKALDIDDELSASYLKKFAECTEKIRIAFPQDKILAPYVNEYTSIKETREKEIRNRKLRKFFLWFVQPIQLVILIGILIPIITTPMGEDIAIPFSLLYWFIIVPIALTILIRKKRYTW